MNLAFDGRVYESPVSWEAEFKDVVHQSSLTPQKVFAGDSEPSVVLVPAREGPVPGGCVDLSAFYNAGLGEAWHEKSPSSNKYPNDLAWLPRGVQTFAGAAFDVRGLIQVASKELNSSRFPPAVQGIPIGRTFNTIHFLHGTGWAATTGTRIGTYLLHYVDGESAEIPIIYGKDVVDWCRADAANKELVVAWSGKAAATQTRGVTLRLYKSQWQNPRAGTAVQSIDFISSMATPAPFLVAMTLE